MQRGFWKCRKALLWKLVAHISGRQTQPLWACYALWSSLQSLWVDRHQCPGEQDTHIPTVPPRAVAPLTSNQSLLLPLVDTGCFTGIRRPKRRSQKSRKKTLASMRWLKEFICGYIKDIPKTVKNKRVEAQKAMLKSYNSKYRCELWKYITLLFLWPLFDLRVLCSRKVADHYIGGKQMH